MPKVSPAHKEAVRRRIMDAALACLERSGYRDVTTRELLAEAGLSIGTFYNYFPSKEHLYEALAEEMMAADVRRIVEGAASGSVGEGLLALLRELAVDQPQGAVAVATFRGRMHAEPDAAEAIARLNRFVVDEFVPLVEKAQAEGWIRADLDAEALVELIDVVWDGMGRRQATGSFQTSYERVGSTLVALLAGGALGDGAPAALTDG